jgi:pyruvate dehydrogenase E2 component (dihydrolipoamide acetyltransferase)
MEEGVIVAWLKADGDDVTEGEPLAEIESDKAITVYEAPHQGTLRILKSEGETIQVGTVIAVIGAASDDDGARNGKGSQQPQARAKRPSSDDSQPRSGMRVKASPIARRIARERGVELETVTGSGPQNRITRADVEAALTGAESTAVAETSAASAHGGTEAVKGEAEVLEPSQLQRVVARRMTEAKSTIPEFILQREVDMEEAATLRAGLAEAAEPGQVVPSFNDLAIKASALALRAQPDANASFADGRIERYSRVNIGFAVAAPGALVVPVVPDADRLSLRTIAERTRHLSERVRKRTVTPPELDGATFTVSNLGMYGIGWFIPVINPPQAAILGVGKVEQRPVAHEGNLELRKRMTVTLVCDHRVIYGAEAAELLAAICKSLEQPLRLLQ